MGRSRDRGFTGHRRTAESFLRALDHYREARILPSAPAPSTMRTPAGRTP